MRFIVSHNRNYQQYCETADSISDKTVELDQLVETVLHFYDHDSFLDAYDWIEIHPDLAGRPHGQSEPTGDYQIRDHVSYAVGDPYSIFDHIPHVLLPNGAVLMSQDAIEEAWRRSHDFEPMENWKGSRPSEEEGLLQ